MLHSQFFGVDPYENIRLLWEPSFEHRYEILTSDSPAGPWKRPGFVHNAADWLDRRWALGRANRFHRVMANPWMGATKSGACGPANPWKHIRADPHALLDPWINAPFPGNLLHHSARR
jgi:hypothetical protein